MLLVASETGHVYTFATPKLQPMITSEAGKALIQTCLHQPDPAPMGQGPHQGDFDVRMSSTGYEETELGYSGLTEEESFKVRDRTEIGFCTYYTAKRIGFRVNVCVWTSLLLAESLAPGETLPIRVARNWQNCAMLVSDIL